MSVVDAERSYRGRLNAATSPPFKAAGADMDGRTFAPFRCPQPNLAAWHPGLDGQARKFGEIEGLDPTNADELKLPE